MIPFFENNIFIHTHIEKTAGSTLVRGLIRAFGQDRVYDIRPGERTRPEFLPEAAKREMYFLTGHFHYGTQDRFFDRTTIYLACVRPPFDRFRSYYNFVKIRPSHPGYKAMAGKSFAEVVEAFLTAENPRLNMMCRALTGQLKPDRETVFAKLENKYLIATPYRSVNDTLRALSLLLGGKTERKPLHTNKGSGTEHESAGELEEQFNRANALDNEMYDYVHAHYEGWLNTLGERLARMASPWTASASVAESGASADGTRLTRRDGTPAAVSPKGRRATSQTLQEFVDREGAVPLSWAAVPNRLPYASNLRDALSPVIVSVMTGLPVRHAQNAEGSERLTAGGTVDPAQQQGALHLWGTGLNSPLKGEDNVWPPWTTFAAHALRGPFSAKILRGKGIPAPGVFGDPMWFLPKLMANDHVPKRWDIGVIVNSDEMEERSSEAAPKKALMRYAVPAELQTSVRVISSLAAPDVQGLFDKIDEIRACRRIVATGIHGVAIAEAFGIPCAWFAKYACGAAVAEVDDMGVRAAERVRDFHAGLGRREFFFYGQAPAAPTDWEKLAREIDRCWTPSEFDARPLFDAFPLRKAVTFESKVWQFDRSVLESFQL